MPQSVKVKTSATFSLFLPIYIYVYMNVSVDVFMHIYMHYLTITYVNLGLEDVCKANREVTAFKFLNTKAHVYVT